jgi:RNA polymerase sigma-70 factor (ECF subfamily)
MASAIGDYSLGWLAAQKVCDEPDIAALVASFGGLLYRVAYSVLRHPAEAEDVVQETFLRVLQYVSQQKVGLAGIRDLRPWLVKITWNLALDRKRRVQPEQIDEAFAASLGSRDRPVDEVLADARRLADVLAVMERLSMRERDVLLLSAVEELTTAEIAAVLGKSESSVRSLLFRARTHVQERLGKLNRRTGGRL